MSARAHRRRGAAALLATLALAAACDGGTAVRVRLTPDPALADGAALAARLTTLQLLFDAEAGFAGLDGDAAPAGLQALDADRDGQAELLLELNVSGRAQLPVVRVDAGRNAGARLAVQARGLDAAGQLVALGGAPARALFVAGQVTEVEVPFNPVRALQPPHLLGAAPQTLPAGFVLATVAFHASRPLDPASLQGRVHVALILDGDGREAVPGTLLAPRACAAGSEMWTFAPAACHAGGPYRGVEIAFDPGVTDLEGQALGDATGSAAASLRLDVELAGLGSCAPATSCLVHGALGVMQGIDAVCDLSSGRFGPAACTLAAGACVDARDAPTWIQASSAEACQALRPGSTLAQGTWCVAQDAWPCDRGADCQAVDSYCNRSLRQCAPQTCDGSCADPAQACADSGCLPRLGSCGEDCRAVGACPALGQRCLDDDDGVPRCQ